VSPAVSQGPRPRGGGRGGADDAKVAAVVEHWLPRFTANGLDYADVRRTLDRVATWDDWPRVWSECADTYEALGREALDRGRTATAADHLRRAALTLQFAHFVLTEDESRRGALHRRQTELYALAAPLLDPPAERVRVPFDGTVLHGYVRRPPGRPDPGLVVLIPGLESTKEQFGTYEPYFLARGQATLSIEGPGQGETWAKLPFREAGYARALEAVAAFARDVDGVDAARVAVVGTSFGGHLALRGASAFDGLVAVVAIAGPYDLSALDAMPVPVRDGFARLVHAPDLEAARPLLAEVTLDGALAALEVPVLVLHGERDGVIPPAEARRIAAALGERAQLWLEPDGGHSCNNLHTRIRPAVADWVHDRVEAAR
jgi:dipeptidyl aminopeptidase/acylaminoacyl peptidase